jgi:hypothetical protein
MFLISNKKVYDALKYIAQVALPGFGALYFALSQTWGLSNGAEVVGTVTSVDVFLGVLLNLSTKAYDKSDAKYDGTVDVTDGEDKTSFLLNVNSDISKLHEQKELRLKVNPVVKTKVRQARKRTATKKTST